MKVERNDINGDLLVEDLVAIYGTVTGTITVNAGGSLDLFGVCGADLIVETGGTAIIDGAIRGNLINRGTVDLRGVVDGDVRTEGGYLHQAPAAVVSGILQA